MTAFDYAETRDDADELIEEFGQDVSVRRTTNSGTAWEPTQATTDYATKAAILDYSARQIDGENILVTDRRALVSAGPLNGVRPVVGDKLVVGGVAIPIVRVVALDPAGVAVMFDCQLRA